MDRWDVGTVAAAVVTTAGVREQTGAMEARLPWAREAPPAERVRQAGDALRALTPALPTRPGATTENRVTDGLRPLRPAQSAGS